jgi:hypothetical protein
MKRAVFCTVASYSHAQRVVDALEASGFAPGDISVLFSDAHDTRAFAHEAHTSLESGADVAAGSVMAGTLGVVIGGVLAVGVPGLGPFLAVGPIVAGLAAMAAGAAGGAAHALRHAGVDEVAARRYHERLQHGGIIIGVHADDFGVRNRAAQVLADAGATDISRVGDESDLAAARI